MKPSRFIALVLLSFQLTATLTAMAGNKPASKSDSSWQPTLVPQPEALAPTGRNPYFILEAGYQCVYQGKESGKKVELTVTVLNETKQVAGVEARVVEERESVNGQLVEVSRNYFAIGTKTKNVYYFGENVDLYKNDGKVSHEGSWLAGVNGAEPGIALPGDNKVGAKYYQEQAPKVAQDRAETVSVSKTVKTPAGTFKNCLKVKETTSLEPGPEYKYYASDIGLVMDGDLKLVRYGKVKWPE